MMKNKPGSLAILTSVICLMSIIPALMLYDELPAQMPIHFNIQGDADNYAPKALACFGLPAFLALINLIVHFGINNDPKKKNAQGPMLSIVRWTIPLLSLIVPTMVLYKSLGYNIRIETIVPALVGLVLVIVGNYLPKAKQNYTIGIKLPWTLNNEDNWNKTHRLGGILFMLGGLGLMVMGFTGASFLLFFAILGIVIFVPSIYSYLLYKKGM